MKSPPAGSPGRYRTTATPTPSINQAHMRHLVEGRLRVLGGVELIIRGWPLRLVVVAQPIAMPPVVPTMFQPPS